MVVAQEEEARNEHLMGAGYWPSASSPAQHPNIDSTERAAGDGHCIHDVGGAFSAAMEVLMKAPSCFVLLSLS